MTSVAVDGDEGGGEVEGEGLDGSYSGGGSVVWAAPRNLNMRAPNESQHAARRGRLVIACTAAGGIRDGGGVLSPWPALATPPADGATACGRSLARPSGVASRI